jgi:ankyrin repeat protein
LPDNTDFLNAIVSGKIETVRTLLDQNPKLASVRDPQRVSALMHAVYRGRKDIVSILLRSHPGLDLFEAAALGDTRRLTELLSESPALVNDYSADGFTALHFAAYFSQPAAASFLIAHNANVSAEARNPTKVMPLHSAASSRNVTVVRHLLEHGAPPSARQQGGWTPLHAAAQNGDLQTLELLLQYGADPSARNDDGKSSSDLALEKGHQQIVDRLVR